MWDVHPANLDRDHKLMIDAVAKYLNPRADEARFNWLYFENPHGRGLAWIARHSKTQDFIGMASAFPRRFYRGDSEQVAWVLGEFCVHERYRMLGPALMLQRTILREMESKNIGMFYDFPSSSMMAIYDRLSIRASFKMLRLACPLRADRRVSELVRLPGLRAPLVAVANATLRRRYATGRLPPHITIVPFAGMCGAEFSELAEGMRGRSGNVIRRSAEYLNWRYFNNPQYRCEMLVVRVHGRLAAYAVFAEEGQQGFLLDLFGSPDPVVLGSLIRSTASVLAARGVSTLSVSILDSHPIVPVLRDCGFREREHSPAIVYVRRIDPELEAQHLARWCLIQGDRDS